ncbi:MAG: helix-turn-helix domain-containing protein [Chitinophagaceae bacterium]|nr:helix-turn-helix domain-containing protein [Chitinophagaceae bacterium]
MARDATMFVAIPMNELLELIESRIFNALDKFQRPSQTIQTDELLRIEEACALLCVSKVTIHKWKKRKLILSYRIGRRIYFKKSELIGSLHANLIPDTKNILG